MYGPCLSHNCFSLHIWSMLATLATTLEQSLPPTTHYVAVSQGMLGFPSSVDISVNITLNSKKPLPLAQQH